MTNMVGDYFNIEAVCPYYIPESQATFTWHRDDDGLAIISGYDPEYDPWGCDCGTQEEEGYFHFWNPNAFNWEDS